MQTLRVVQVLTLVENVDQLLDEDPVFEGDGQLLSVDMAWQARVHEL